MRLGLSVEFEGKNYDILELPGEAFANLIPGLSEKQFHRIDKYFHDYWEDPTIRRRHVLAFAADIAGTSIDYIMLNRENISFDEADLEMYVQQQTKQGTRPS